MSKSRAITSSRSVQDAVRNMLLQLLESGRIDSVFALRTTGTENRYCYSLVSSADMVDEIVPFFPVMPVQGARALTELTGTEPVDGTIAALLRPCEIRAFVENVKQSQGSLENICIISCTCPGVIPAGDVLRSDHPDQLTGDPENNRRSACSICRDFVPGPQADMTLILESDEPVEGTLLYLHSEKAEKLMEGIGDFQTGESGSPSDEVKLTAGERTKAYSQFIRQGPSTEEGLTSLVTMFSACIGCRGCREACPLCNCILCDYETDRTVHPPGILRTEAGRKGSIRIPSGTLQFQLGRLVHISPMCVACGQCSDVCPVDIPVAEMFIRAGHHVQQTLDYSPGSDLEDPSPMSTYRERELLDIMD